ncbi:MAG TPA: TIGR03118 family protein [Pirellulales bacterium]|nr:TIGR03118 family protein [Pirellulales bacterium]
MHGWRKAQLARSGRHRSACRQPPRAAEALEPRHLLTSGYLPLNLVSDQPATALIQDANLVNPWGQALNANGGDIWVADRGAGMASLYFGAVAGSPFQTDTLAVNIPGGNPTGVAANGTTSFMVQSGVSSGPASFLFGSAGGNITGWNQGVPPPSPSNQAQVAASSIGAIFTGLALANNGGQNFLYAADFHNNRIDVFNSSFQPVAAPGAFSDPGLPAGFAPYNVVNLGGQLLVCYARQDASGLNAVAGAGNGALDLFDLNGVLQKELFVGQSLNAPWGAVLAPSTFGDFAGDLLVANNGNGQIEAFNPLTGAFAGTLSLPSGAPLVIDGLRGLSFGNGLTAGNGNELFFSAGTSGGQHGLFGAIQSAQSVGLVAQGTALVATSTISFNGTLAVFSDAQNLPASSFSANINWGDGSITSGGISALAAGGFAISGSHTYASSGLKSISIQVSDPSGHMVTTSALARVVSPGLSMTAQTITPTEGAAFSGTVATFTDGDGNMSAGAYTATILWGDGATTAGTVSFSAGKFSVAGSHTYLEEGTNSVTVKVNDVDGANASVVSTAKVADAPLSGTHLSIAATLGATFSGTVASFSDANPNGTASDFTATIDWGDGATTAGTIVSGQGAVFSIAGSHSFADAGASTVTITINDVGGAKVVVQDPANVVDIDVLAATLVPIEPTQGSRFTGMVATVVDSNLATSAGALAATIDWGDGTTSEGTVSGAAGAFTVADSHTYIGEGFYTLSILVAHVGGAATATDQETIIVADTGTLSVSGATFAATEGMIFAGEVATASDTYAAPAADFLATIDWGDGTTSEGTVSGPNGQFAISGQHVYAEEGTYSPVVSIADLAPGRISATAAFTTVVADAPLSATGKTLNLTEGQAFAGTVAKFDDASPLGTAGDFTATIDWGDGTSSIGTVSGTGGFDVSGTHTYEVGGTYDATVTIYDEGGSTALATSTMLVADYPLTAAGVAVDGTEGQLFTGSVATFIDTNPDGGNLSDFSATIDWGDGVTTGGTIRGAAGNYTVSGSHTFVDVSDKVIVVIDDIGGASATATSSASVTDANTLTPLDSSTLATTEGQTASGVLATFADSYSGNPTGDFSAEVDWGDGQTTSAVVSGQAPSFTVSGSHVYAEEGTYMPQIVLRHKVGTADATAKAAVDVADAALTATALTIGAVEGNPFAGRVASFEDANLFSSASDFTATINWGDGTSTTAGTVTMVAAGSFLVSGGHTYAEEVNNLPVTVIVTDLGGSQATARSTAEVADAPLSATPVTISATEGTQFAGTVATFTDGNPSATTADFTATLDWGDGTTATTGTVSVNPTGGFIVVGSHTYIDEGSNVPIRITINDRGGSAVTATSKANIADAPLSGGGITFSPTEGITFSGTVATFTDANPLSTPADFTATIDWGDGKTTTGTVSAVAGGFLVDGTHLYADEATENATVTIRDAGGSKTTATSTAVVADAPLSGGPALTIAATSGVLFTGTVGTFTDGNPNATKGDFTATIDWGDGSATTPGTIATAPGGVFLVSGSHNYAAPAASRAMRIVVSDQGGSGVTLTASAHVASTRFAASGVTLTAVEGATFRGTVATCNDSDPNPADYAATIDWGDGTTTLGTLSSAPGGGFVILGTHVFAEAGSWPFTVTVVNPSLDKLSVTSRANVADAPLNATGVTFSATEGSTFSGTVATFADANPAGKVADYSATIVWGDGITSQGTIASTGGGFSVIGSHVYAEEQQGVAVSVTIRDVDGAQAAANSTANVADAPLNLSPSSVDLPSSGTVNNVLLATFTDQGGAEPVGNYAATINWGDGTSASIGLITQSAGVFRITGSHHYQQVGNYTIQVTVRDEGGSTATVDVQATDPPSPDQLYVEAVYEDVLARPADPSGLAYWVQQLEAGQPRFVFVNSLDHSAEYFGNIIVTPAYRNYLGRVPDAAGLAYWVDQMQNHGLTDEQLEAGFISSPEFFAHAGGTNKAFVDALYQDLLGRPADASGETYWVDQLVAGLSRTAVAYNFATGRERESQRITDDYMHYLGRQPDAQGLNYWVAQLAGGETNEQVITGFVASDEYFNKHTEM